MFSKVIVEGGEPLIGTLTVSGAKNSALKLIAAALFSNEDIVLENVPRIENVTSDLEIAEALGAKVEWLNGNKVKVNGSEINKSEIPYELGSKYRTASLHAAALLYRFGKVSIPKPGGCKIGHRSLNRWVGMWESLGIEVNEDDEYYHLDGQNAHAGSISFKKSTHMGTDAAILFSMFLSGETLISNAAEEPEIDELISFVNQMGASVERTESRQIKIVGTNQFKGTNFKVQPDRNEVVTLATAALITKGNITINKIDRNSLLAFTNYLTRIGARYEISGDELRVWRSQEDLKSVDVTTAPYPGIMTDWQPLITLIATQIEGTTHLHDTVYWDRFGYTKDLNRMGAKIGLMKPSEIGVEAVISDDNYDLKAQGEPNSVAKIEGATTLRGTKMDIPDLRAGAALILAALAAEGKSEIYGYSNVSRGYENFIGKLQELGAKIRIE